MPGMASSADIRSLFVELKGKELVRISQQRITNTDLKRQQSRLRLPRSSKRAIKGLLSFAQRAAANIYSRTKLESMVKEGILFKPEDKLSAMKLEGVRVQLFVFSPGEPRIKGEGTLKKWNCGSIVITAGKSKVPLRPWDHLNVGDRVDIWGFKDKENNNLYFAIQKLQ